MVKKAAENFEFGTGVGCGNFEFGTGLNCKFSYKGDTPTHRGVPFV